MDMTWRKSSYSTSNGGACVEVGVWRKPTRSTSNGGQCVEVGVWPNPSTSNGGTCVEVGAPPWRKSTHSNSNGGDCIEAATLGAAVAVRDTKDDGHGPVLRFTPRAWAEFTTTLN
jgi:hypothetical protein